MTIRFSCFLLMLLICSCAIYRSRAFEPQTKGVLFENWNIELSLRAYTGSWGADPKKDTTFELRMGAALQKPYFSQYRARVVRAEVRIGSNHFELENRDLKYAIPYNDSSKANDFYGPLSSLVVGDDKNHGFVIPISNKIDMGSISITVSFCQHSMSECTEHESRLSLIRKESRFVWIKML